MIYTTNPALVVSAKVPTFTVNINGVICQFILLLGGRHKALKEFFDIVRQQALEGIPLMNPNMPFKAEMVCGDGFWAALPKPEKWLAGRCVAYMVVKGILPFTFDNSKSGPTKWYRIKK